MALAGLVGNYGSSDDDEEDKGEGERMEQVKGAPAGDSDDDEDEDEGDDSKMDQVPTVGGASGQAAKSKLPSAMELFDAIDGASFIGGKRKDVEDDFPPLSSSKKAKPSPKAQAPPQAGKPGGGRGSSPFVPPQLGRPGGNIVTEDVNAWMTKQQRQDKEKKESWRQKEARKRDRGQVSRQGSYQEDEKRILRNLDAESS